jgi:hypothetical protein
MTMQLQLCNLHIDEGERIVINVITHERRGEESRTQIKWTWKHINDRWDYHIGWHSADDL